jgi:adenylyltransferase/sulfurtransferase
MDAQEKLANASILVIGAGGLGCPLLLYLAAAGVGEISVVDDDKVSLSNLQRQVLFDESDIGRFKVVVVKEKLERMNHGLTVNVWNHRWMPSDFVEKLHAFDVVVDATDNFASRYMINDACVLMKKPLVFGAVSQFEGQVAVFNAIMEEGGRSVNYRDLFPTPPKTGEVRSCAEAGVLGILPGVIGVLQATEVLKLLTGMGTLLLNRLLCYNALEQDFFKLELMPHPEAPNQLPESIEHFMETDYEWLCGLKTNDGVELSYQQYLQLKASENIVLVDLRMEHEMPRISLNECLCIPLQDLEHNLYKLNGQPVLFFCQSGKRSLQAVEIYHSKFNNSRAFSLKGGVQSFFQ